MSERQRRLPSAGQLHIIRGSQGPDHMEARMAKDGKKTVAWDFVYIPSEEWKKNLKQALIAYAADNSKWDGVKNAFVDGWKTEKAASE